MRMNFLRHRGVLEWAIQRASAVLLAVFTLWIFSFLVTHPNLNFESWRGLFGSPFARVFSFITLVGLCAHMWIGMWTVVTDYLTPLHLGSFAKLIQGLCKIGIIGIISIYLLWGSFILLWSF